MNNKEHEIAHAILRYLNQHADAQDTLEGIAHWWLLHQVIEQHLPLVKQALADLVRQDLVLMHERRGTEARYGINPQKRDEISRLLKERTES